jgi:lipopolysaccharide export system permease protein
MSMTSADPDGIRRRALAAVTEPSLPAQTPAGRLDWLTAGHVSTAPAEPERRRFNLGISILDRYVVKEMIPPFVFGFVAILLFMTVNMLFLAADYIFGKHIPVTLTLRWLILEIPVLLYIVLPFATLVGAMLGFGRLAGDRELTAMRTSGVPLRRIAIPGYVVGLIVMIAAFLINENLAPASQRQADVVMRQIEYRSTVPIIAPNQMIKTTNGSQEYTVYVGSVDPTTGLMRNIQISVMQAGYYPVLWTAATGRQMGAKIALYNGVETHTGKDGFVNAQQHFDYLEVPIGDSMDLYSGSLNGFDMNAKELRSQVASEKQSGEDSSQDEMILDEKYAMPAASLIAVLLALPLAARFGRYGWAIGALLTITAMFVYYLLMAMTNAMGKNGIMPAALAAWIPNIVFGGIGLAMLFKEER